MAAKPEIGVYVVTDDDNNPERHEILVKYGLMPEIQEAMRDHFPGNNIVQLPAETPNSAFDLESSRSQLELIRQSADERPTIMAMDISNSPPSPRASILAGYATGLGMPIAALQTGRGSTGESGLRFNLMVHAGLELTMGQAAVSKSLPLTIAHDSETFLAESIKRAAQRAFKTHDIFGRQPALADMDLPEVAVPEDTAGKKIAYVQSPYGFSESTRGFYADELLPVVGKDFMVYCPWDEERDAAVIIENAPEDEKARTLVDIGLRHIRRQFVADVVVTNADQEPPDVGTLFELGVSSALGKPGVLYRSDFRLSNDSYDPYYPNNPANNLRLNGMVQAASTLWLPNDEAINRQDKFATSLTELSQQLGELASRLDQ